MNAQINSKILSLLMETREAYDLHADYGQCNADIAEFATLSIREYREKLSNPELKKRELIKLLRTGSDLHRNADPESCWATFIANYVKTNINQDLEKSRTPQTPKRPFQK